MKVLIWDKGLPLKNTGGPAGYLWNLKQEVLKNHNNSLLFYSDIIDKKNGRKSILNKVVLLILKIIKCEHWAKIYIDYYYRGATSRKEMELLRSVDYVHFHTISSLKAYAKYARETETKTIITTHSPEPNIFEISNKYQVIAKYFAYFPSIKK